LTLIENILSNPLFWILGGILLLILSPIFYLVYCAVCALWFPKREPGYPFESTQDDKTFRYSQYGNPHDRTQYFDEEDKDEFEEELFEDILDNDIFENYDGPSQIDKDKLVRARLERFHLSEDEAELIFGNEWRDKLGQEHHMLFFYVERLKPKLMETGFEQMFTDNPEPLFREKVSHIIDKVIQMIESVYNEDPEYTKHIEKLCEEELGKTGYYYLKEAWEFFKIHKRSPWDFSHFTNTLNAPEAYKILGLAVTATIQQVKKKYRELVLKWHPDRNKTDKIQAEKELVKINQAYETIMAAA